MAELCTEWGDMPMDNQKDCCEYLRRKYGGKRIEGIQNRYVYENPEGKRYAIRIAENEVNLMRRQYYAQYNCQGVYVGIRDEEEGKFYLGCIGIPEAGKTTTVTPETPEMHLEGYLA